MNGRKNWIGGSVGLLILLMLAIAACSQATEEQRKRQTLPDFHFEGIDGQELNQGKLAPDKPIVVFYFDPDCSHCQETIAAILETGSATEGQEWVMVSAADRSRAIPYLQEKGLLSRPNFHLGLCSPQDFLDSFGTTQAPTTLFYDSDHDLKRAYKGVVNVEGILKGIEMSAD